MHSLDGTKMATKKVKDGLYQKFHGVTKFVHYMKLFGNGIIFYGGIGECNHKIFVKHTGANTQKRISTFTSQVAQRYYETLILHISKKV
jgi:hypothetical protein